MGCGPFGPGCGPCGGPPGGCAGGCGGVGGTTCPSRFCPTRIFRIAPITSNSIASRLIDLIFPRPIGWPAITCVTCFEARSSMKAMHFPELSITPLKTSEASGPPCGGPAGAGGAAGPCAKGFCCSKIANSLGRTDATFAGCVVGLLACGIASARRAPCGISCAGPGCAAEPCASGTTMTAPPVPGGTVITCAACVACAAAREVSDRIPAPKIRRSRLITAPPKARSKRPP